MDLKSLTKIKSHHVEAQSIHSIEQLMSMSGGYYEARQLTVGQFGGQLVSSRFNYSSIHLNCTGQAIERELKNYSDDYIFLVAVTDPDEHAIYDGLIYGKGLRPTELVGIIPPGAQFLGSSPPNIGHLYWRISRGHLSKHLEGSVELMEWIADLRQPTAVRLPWLAQRLRTDLTFCFEALCELPPQKSASFCESTALVSTTTAFTFAFAMDPQAFSNAKSASVNYQRFTKARHYVLSQIEEFCSTADDQMFRLDFPSEIGSPRAVQAAFSACVNMGPLAYANVLRLHNVRRYLSDPERRGDSISDIAAALGFWDHAGFARRYRRQFGETPSQTRSRINH